MTEVVKQPQTLAQHIPPAGVWEHLYTCPHDFIAHVSGLSACNSSQAIDRISVAVHPQYADVEAKHFIYKGLILTPSNTFVVESVLELGNEKHDSISVFSETGSSSFTIFGLITRINP